MLKKILLCILSVKFTQAMRNITLFGNDTLGYYYVEAFIGTPLQKKSFILDTGSHITILPCTDCVDCGEHMNGLFDPSLSSTFEKVDPLDSYFGWQCPNLDDIDMCAFTQTYEEGSSYMGYYATDNFVFENELNKDTDKSLRHVFGCANKETNLFSTQKADGIIGFGISIKDTGKLISK